MREFFLINRRIAAAVAAADVAALFLEKNDETDGRTDGQTPDR